MCGGLKRGPQAQGGHSRRFARPRFCKRGEKFKLKNKDGTSRSRLSRTSRWISTRSPLRHHGRLRRRHRDGRLARHGRALDNINEFYAHESCGQCTPCREGSLWMKKITDRMLPAAARTRIADTLKNVADNIAGPNDLRLRRSLLLADPELRREVPRRIRRSRRTKASAAPDAAGIHAGGIDRRRGRSPNRPARPRSRLGTSRRCGDN